MTLQRAKVKTIIRYTRHRSSSKHYHAFITEWSWRVQQGRSFIIFLWSISINFCASYHLVLLWYFMICDINIGGFFLVDVRSAIRASASAFCVLIYGPYTWFTDAVLDNGILMAFRLGLRQESVTSSMLHKISGGSIKNYLLRKSDSYCTFLVVSIFVSGIQ